MEATSQAFCSHVTRCCLRVVTNAEQVGGQSCNNQYEDQRYDSSLVNFAREQQIDHSFTSTTLTILESLTD